MNEWYICNVMSSLLVHKMYGCIMTRCYCDVISTWHHCNRKW